MKQQVGAVVDDPDSRFGVVPLSLALQQRERLMYYDREALYDRIVTHWEDTCTEAIVEIKSAMLREIAAAAVARCSSNGINGAADQHLFAGLMMTVSPWFDDHPTVQR